jgi:hypothetical protein
MQTAILKKPSSAWAGRMDDGKVYYTSPSTYGLRHMCKHCGRKNTGIGTITNRATGVISTRNHAAHCHEHPEVKRQAELAKASTETC